MSLTGFCSISHMTSVARIISGPCRLRNPLDYSPCLARPAHRLIQLRRIQLASQTACILRPSYTRECFPIPLWQWREKVQSVLVTTIRRVFVSRWARTPARTQGGQLLWPNNHQRPNVQVLSIKSKGEAKAEHWHSWHQSVTGALSIMDKVEIETSLATTQKWSKTWLSLWAIKGAGKEKKLCLRSLYVFLVLCRHVQQAVVDKCVLIWAKRENLAKF